MLLRVLMAWISQRPAAWLASSRASALVANCTDRSEGQDTNLHLSARNIQKVDVLERSDLNAGQILRRPNLVFTAGAIEALAKEISA